MSSTGPVLAPPAHERPRWRVAQVALIYFAAAGVWIVGTDFLFIRFVADPVTLSRLQTAKGWFFLVATAVILYGVLRHRAGLLAASQVKLEAREAQLRQAQKLEAVGHLAAGIAHDFNNLLSIVQGNAALIREVTPPDRVEVLDDLDALERAAESGALMVRQLLGFSRQADLSLVPLDLRATCAQVVSMLQRLLPAAIAIDWQPEDQVPAIRGDPTAIQQVLLNLATNARDAMPDGGRLSIALARREMVAGDPGTPSWFVPGAYVELAVSDTGSGMTEEVKARIFDPFFTTKEAGKGTGLGLSQIYGLVKQHGGYVLVESTVGQGTRFQVYFPAVHEAPVPIAPVRREAGTRGNNEMILLVEDDPALQRTGRRVLERLGYRVVTAADGRLALAALSAPGAEVDLVLCDVSMPNMGGRELFQEVRRRGDQVRFVFASGFAARQVLEGVSDVSHVPYLQKPWTIPELAATLRAALGTPTPGSPPDASG